MTDVHMHQSEEGQWDLSASQKSLFGAMGGWRLISWLTDGVLNDWWGGWCGWVHVCPWGDKPSPSLVYRLNIQLASSLAFVTSSFLFSSSCFFPFSESFSCHIFFLLFASALCDFLFLSTFPFNSKSHLLYFYLTPFLLCFLNPFFYILSQ